MRIREVMKRRVETIGPHSTVQQAAAMIMDEKNGLLPVTVNNRIVGTISEREIYVRAAQKNFRPHQMRVKEVMSGEVMACSAKAPAMAVGRQMIAGRIKELCVLDEKNRLVGVVSLFALAGAINQAAFWKAALGALRG